MTASAITGTTQLTLVIPNGLAAGTYQIRVVNGDDPSKVSNSVALSVLAESQGGSSTPVVSLSQQTVTVTAGRTSTVNASVLIYDTVTSQVTVSSSNNLVATAVVDTTGLITITGVGQGVAIITVHPTALSSTDKSQDKYITVSVTAAATGLSADRVADDSGLKLDQLGTPAGGLNLNDLGNSSNGGGQQGSTIVGITPFFMNIITPNGVVGQSYSGSIQALANYTITYSIVAGTLPQGLSLSSSGAITGVPVSSGTYSFTVQAITSQGVSSSKQITITISAASGSNGGGGYTTQLTTAQLTNLNNVQPFRGLQMPDGYNTGLQMPAEVLGSSTQTSGTSYTVKKGDTLFSIAQKVYGKGNGMKWRGILAANPKCLSIPGDTKTLKIGAVLIIPALK